MSELVTLKKGLTEKHASRSSVPNDIISFGIILADTHQEVSEIKRRADGMFFGLVGLDALLGIVPVVGGIYSAATGFNLLRHAIRAKCGAGTISFGAILVIIDVIMGFFPGVGDIGDLLFRSHAFFANRILDTTEYKLMAIEAARQEADKGTLMHEDVTEVRNIILRGGKSEKSTEIRSYIILGIVGILLYSCVQEYRDRQSAIRDCKADGGWLCSWRY